MDEKDKLENQIARKIMLKTYFNDWDVKPEFNKEFVSTFGDTNDATLSPTRVRFRSKKKSATAR